MTGTVWYRPRRTYIVGTRKGCRNGTSLMGIRTGFMMTAAPRDNFIGTEHLTNRINLEIILLVEFLLSILEITS